MSESREAYYYDVLKRIAKNYQTSDQLRRRGPRQEEAKVKLILESTSTIERVNGAPARVWKGRTESGIEVTCWINIVQVKKSEDCAQFERELSEIEVRRELVSFDMRMVL